MEVMKPELMMKPIVPIDIMVEAKELVGLVVNDRESSGSPKVGVSLAVSNRSISYRHTLFPRLSLSLSLSLSEYYLHNTTPKALNFHLRMFMYVSARPLYHSSFSLVTDVVSSTFFNLYTTATSKLCSLFICKGFSAS
ncbi:hypothetical protein VNO78_22444 [Psophocarpus tetragonolobus]|uniref:Uncharacterized protein n=1 Tax=Psophocarpus tetragonolobus TaxID=3891 RepID=A0AAN9XC01_PSOTE